VAAGPHVIPISPPISLLSLLSPLSSPLSSAGGQPPRLWLPLHLLSPGEDRAWGRPAALPTAELKLAGQPHWPVVKLQLAPRRRWPVAELGGSWVRPNT
jgi:hypothetical protein